LGWGGELAGRSRPIVRRRQRDAAAGADGDGMADLWEINNGLNATNATDG